jgi:hypothetical protein
MSWPGAAPDVRRAGLQDFVDVESLGPLVRVIEQQRPLVPCGDQRRLAGGYGDRAAVGAFQCGIAAHMVGMAMRIHELRKRRAVESHPRRDERQRERRVLAITGVDHDAALAAFQHDLIGRKPVAHEDVHLRRHGVRHHFPHASKASFRRLRGDSGV